MKMLRRQLLTAGAGALAAGGLLASAPAMTPGAANGSVSHPDAELLSLCAQHDAIQRRIDDAYPHPATLELERIWDAYREPLEDEQEELIQRMIEARAVTVDGFRARATSLLLWDPDSIKLRARAASGVGDNMLAALLRDLTGGAG